MIPAHITKKIKENNPSDTTLSITDAGLSDSDVSFLVAMLRAHLYITALDLSSNNISNLGVKDLATLTKLKKINLENNNVSDDGALILIKCEHLDFINLTRNNLHPNKVDELVAALKSRQAPLTIHVKSNMLGDDEKRFTL
jgi:Ran GTPase-activating protein (RanGAP) involved in mRNA processing and transport